LIKSLKTALRNFYLPLKSAFLLYHKTRQSPAKLGQSRKISDRKPPLKRRF